MSKTDDVKLKEKKPQSLSISLRIDGGFLERFDDITGYFAYNRNEAIKEGMRKLFDDLTKRRLKIEKLKKR
jgi:hypothetical protein